ncbi:MAG TPA: acetyl-CoA carboxylase biotin carboxyl carrier protein subunit [Candidatus Limnocylindrales bacterium]|nr:acetyl-CoA carboxylase biotin carboxyl carrier protein subunit [Candidatus Limnocylindrales bacterium]
MAQVIPSGRGLRVRPGRRSQVAGVDPIVAAPPDPPGSIDDPVRGPSGSGLLVDGTLEDVRLERRGPDRAQLRWAEDPGPAARVVFIGGPVLGPDGVTRQEVLVDGWRVEVELEDERRAALRERARRAAEAVGHGGPTEVRSVFPGRVVSVAVATGDPVVAGQPLLVIEAMKMQNELRSPREGRVAQVEVGPGTKVDVGDLLLAIE